MHFSDIEHDLSNTLVYSDDILMMGDFNISLLELHSSSPIYLLNIMEYYNLTQPVKESTLIRRYGSSSIDHQ